jgi:hypothetical protein
MTVQLGRSLMSLLRAKAGDPTGHSAGRSSNGLPFKPKLNFGFTTLITAQSGFTASEPNNEPIGTALGTTSYERLMLDMTGAGPQIDTIHARAICDEIGERLRTILSRDAGNDLPPRLRHLLAQLAKADDEPSSPSIVPSIDEMIAQTGTPAMQRAQHST